MAPPLTLTTEPLRACNPRSSPSFNVTVADGTITAAWGDFRLQGGAFPGAPASFTAMCAFAPYNLENVKQVGYDVLANRPKQAAYRAPGAPMGASDHCR